MGKLQRVTGLQRHMMVFLLPDLDSKNFRVPQGAGLKPILLVSSTACKLHQPPSFHLQFGRYHTSICNTIMHLLVKYSHIKYDLKYCLWKPDKRDSRAKASLQIFVCKYFLWYSSSSTGRDFLHLTLG